MKSPERCSQCGTAIKSPPRLKCPVCGILPRGICKHCHYHEKHNGNPVVDEDGQRRRWGRLGESYADRRVRPPRSSDIDDDAYRLADLESD